MARLFYRGFGYPAEGALSTLFRRLGRRHVVGGLLPFASGTFTRSTEGSFRTGPHSLAWAGINELRYDLGVPLFEGSATNLLLSEGVDELPPATEDGTTPGWDYTATLGVGAAVAAPDGRAVGRRFTYATNNLVQASIDPSGAGTANRTISVWVREESGDSSDNLALTLREGGSAVSQSAIDTADGSWRRFQVTGSTDLAPDGRLQLRDVNGTAGYVIDAALFQLETGSFASSYIRSGSARGADLLEFTSNQVPTEMVSGRWEFDFYPLAPNTAYSGSKQLYCFPGGGATDGIRLNGSTLQVRVGASNEATAALTWSKDQRITVSLDGSSVTVSGATTGNGQVNFSSGTTPFDASSGLFVGGRSNGADPAFCRISEPMEW